VVERAAEARCHALTKAVIASDAKQSRAKKKVWIASSLRFSQ